MTKCLFKALKAVNLENHVELFRSLGYDSAGALAHFRKEHFKQLNLSSEELLRVHALLDVLKEATREGKICPHYSKSTKPISTRAKSTEPPTTYHRNSQIIKSNTLHSKKQSNGNLKSKRSSSSVGIAGRLSSLSVTNKNHANGFILQRPSSGAIQQVKNHDQQFFGPKSLPNRPAVQHVKVKSYNYGIPTNKPQRNSPQRVRYQHETNFNHPSIFVPPSHHPTDLISYAKPAEIYVYARKRPLLSSEANFRDIITVPDNKHMIMSENKANLDCTPLLKTSEFQFDQVFAPDASNKQVFASTVLPFLSSNQRHNLTYICFGQTGSGKSHTIFGSRHTDGLLIYCAQLLLQEINLQDKLLCSFYEIYNNQVYDLTDTGKRLFVREDGDHHVNIVGLTEIVLKSLDTLRSIIYDGLARRHHGKSAFNSNSSRSHAICQIILKNTSNQSDYFRLVFIDLAGSERAIDAQNNQKQTRREGAQINSSLLALKECIRSMDMTHSHAPFRQSKLTHILRDSLVGSKTRTCLMANVSPADDCCQCSLNTLQYASRIRDISIRHRHRSMPISSTQRNYLDNEQEEIVEPMAREKPQRTFKPATASTPVQRRMTSVDHRTYMAMNQTGADTRKQATTRKTSEIDWQAADDDIPVSGSGDNRRIKSVLSSTREFVLNNNANNQNQSSSFYVTRYEQPRKKNLNQEENRSSYFPPPQSDLKKSSPIPIHETQIPEQWITVPAPSTRRLSDSSIEPSNSIRIIPIVPVQMSDDNQYSSTTGTESLGTKITKLAIGTNPHSRTNKMDNLNLNKQYDTATTTTTITTTDVEQGLYSDRQATHRDQTGFFSNRDDPLYENHLKPTNLTTITQRTSPTATPKNSSHHYKSDAVSTSSKKTFSSPNKSHHRNRHVQPSSSSSSSLTSVNSHKNHRYSSPKHHQHRIVPYHNSDSEDVKYQPKKSSQTIDKIPIMKNEQEQTDDQFLLEQFPDEPSKNVLQAPLDQIKHFYEQTTSALSPSKDFGVRVSGQLNTLRTLLETRLTEQEDSNHHHPMKDASVLKSSPGTFTKDFLQSYKYKNHPTELISDLDDDENDDQLIRRNKDKYQSDALSTSPSESSLTDEIHQEKVHSNSTVSSTPTITSNYTPKIDTRESRVVPSSSHSIYSHRASISNSDIIESTSNSERISNANSGSQNPYTGASCSGSSAASSRSHTPVRISSSNTFNVTNGTRDHLIDSGKGSSLLTGTSFDVLMNSLKSMREKDLDYLIHSSDDSLIRVTD